MNNSSAASYYWNFCVSNINLAGLYHVETSGYGCSNIDSFRVIFSSADFSYEQDVCDPLRITFKNESPNSTVVDWNFDNGQHAPGNANPVTTYTTFGNYNVTLTIINSNGFNESMTKTIAVQAQAEDIILTRDTTICKGSSIQLNAITALNYCWTPLATLSASNIANPVASPLVATTYYLNSLVTGSDLIVNGNFSAGNTGFTTGYTYAATNTTEGEYFIGGNPGAWNPNFQSTCPDHSGTGNMMMVNGNPISDINVWSQKVTVTPNTNYAFSTWIQSLFSDNPAQLMFSINGIPVGNMITASLPICNWSQFYTTWNSGNNTTAVISIINKNTIVWGNDFALDDISFAPVFIKRDSVTINIEDPVIKARLDTTVCEGIDVQLNARGNFASYKWLPATGLSNNTIANPVASPLATTVYIVNGVTINGCKASDTTNITIMPKPLLKAGNDTVLCGSGSVQLNATGNAGSYSWSPSAGLSDSSIANPVANLTRNSQYIVRGESLQGCNAYDTINIRVSTIPVVEVNNDTTICEGNSVQLNVFPATASYTWSPASGLSDTKIASPVATPLATTQYILAAGNPDGCIGRDSVWINVSSKPLLSLVGDTTVCRTAAVQLNRADSSGYYSWSPSTGLSNSSTANPIATPLETTKYSVVVTDAASGCKSEGDVDIVIRQRPAFNTSGDTEICYGKTTRLQASGGDIYQWTSLVMINEPELNEIVVNPGVTTLYTVHIAERICNYDTLIELNVTVHPSPLITTQKSNDINCVTTTAQLSATGGDRYIWSPSVNLDNANVHNPVASPDSTTIFTVKGTNEYGCSAEDSIAVTVTKEGNPLYLVPNAFTPNNDGINDCLSLKKWGYMQLDEFSIYNRWGEKIFSTKNRMDCWDGTYKGIKQSSGTFVYVIRAKTLCGNINRKGLVTLIR
ncbi:MAG: gliding motility-associated C-terminal domain-containing protein [Chitinophagaceae bacterium]|nr:gliding motility-associated C-terminal domain-containing protein [Chitinophagaceae bacterium]